MKTAGSVALGGIAGLMAAIVGLGPTVVPGSAAHLAVDGGVVQAFTFALPDAIAPEHPDGACNKYRAAAKQLELDADVLDVDIWFKLCVLNLGVGQVVGQGHGAARTSHSSATTEPAEGDRRKPTEQAGPRAEQADPERDGGAGPAKESPVPEHDDEDSTEVTGGSGGESDGTSGSGDLGSGGSEVVDGSSDEQLGSDADDEVTGGEHVENEGPAAPEGEAATEEEQKVDPATDSGAVAGSQRITEAGA